MLNDSDSGTAFKETISLINVPLDGSALIKTFEVHCTVIVSKFVTMSALVIGATNQVMLKVTSMTIVKLFAAIHIATAQLGIFNRVWINCDLPMICMTIAHLLLKISSKLLLEFCCSD